MNVALVLDLRGELATDVAAGLRALALALAKAEQMGDRFSLVVAGRSAGVALGPDSFKHGPLSVTLDRLLTGTAPDKAPVLGLADALATAYREVSRTADPDAVLGRSAVFVVTGQTFADEADALTDLAHQGALAGIPLSVFGVGSGVSATGLDRLALAGQGSRRLLDARADAPRLVEDELTGASQAVARALRLRIRLAKDVHLVNVIGSHRLDEAHAQRVREAERSIDLQLARHMGLEADRGEDEDGIQIVIPAFRGGDAHTILLDVVAPGAGPVAEVSVRYKDLVFLRNGVARASLALAPGERTHGPLERSVLRNLLAFRLSGALTAAGDALAASDAAGAAARIEDARALLAGVAARVPGLAGDPTLARDAAMLAEYGRLIAGGYLHGPERVLIVDSLRYAGRLVLLPRPAALAAGAA